MKKLFLLFGMAAFTDACAQQNELFDIQKKVKEKIAADRKAIGCSENSGQDITIPNAAIPLKRF